jgi:hypothetical protein
MTEHLPECWATFPSDPPAWCICDELRACEARTLNAARDAVAAVEGGYSVPLEMPVGAFISAMRREHLAAIDALKESK